MGLTDNQEDGEWSCTNSRRLKADLKGAMGFQGLVQSDWGAGHGTTVREGLDMDMPMASTPDFSPTELSKVAPADIDDAVTRTCGQTTSTYMLLIPSRGSICDDHSVTSSHCCTAVRNGTSC